MPPDTALAYIRMLRSEIGLLSRLPQRHRCVNDEPWRSRGIRRLMVKNFIVYYRVEDSIRRVYILNIIYAKRDQLHMLTQIKID